MTKHVPALLLFAAIGCSSTADRQTPPDDGLGEAGVLEFRLDVGDAVPLGPFTAELTITREGEPFTGAYVWVAAKMPGHTHASDAQRAEELEPGVYEIQGLALDMPGEWELDLDAEGEDAHDSTTFEVRVE